MKKIEGLTQEQEAKLAVYRDKWLAIGLSTAPADHAKAEDAIRRAYVVAGHEPPKQIIWAGSPLSGSIVISILKNDDLMKKVYADFQKHLKTKCEPTPAGERVSASVRDSVSASVGDSVRDSVWASVRDSVWASVRDSVSASVSASVGDSVRDSVGDSVSASVGASVWDSVWDSVGDSVSASVGASVWDSVWDSVGASVWDSVSASVGASVRASVWDSVSASVGASVRDEYWRAGYGQHDANWLGFYDYFLSVLKLEACEKLIPLMDLARHANWFYPYKNICVVSEKPTVCKLDGIRIHCDGGPAIMYPDGFGVWALHGVRVPQWLAETSPDALEPKQILALPNAEQRKEGIRKIGIDRMREPLKVEVVHTFKDYELWTIEFEGRRIGPYLKMVNPSTGQIHVEGVEVGIKTCQEALAWRGGFTVYQEPVWSA